MSSTARKSSRGSMRTPSTSAMTADALAASSLASSSPAAFLGFGPGLRGALSSDAAAVRQAVTTACIAASTTAASVRTMRPHPIMPP